jgi:hypothetical protein
MVAQDDQKRSGSGETQVVDPSSFLVASSRLVLKSRLAQLSQPERLRLARIAWRDALLAD